MDKKKVILLFAGFLLVLDIFVWQEVFHENSKRYLEVSFFDVGQGDSAFIETPQGQQILIDGGPGSAVLEKLAKNMPFWDKSIDLVVLTHPEKDHMQGLLDVLQKYQVDYFLWTGIFKDDAENKELASLLNVAQSRENNFLAAFSTEPTKVITAKQGQKLKLGDVLIEVISPLEDLSGKLEKNTSNDSSVVLRLVYGKNSFLFTGDIDEAAEKMLVENSKNIDSDVLKVAHHGSKYSSSELFLQSVSPEIAVIEVGENSYGHPSPEALQRLDKYDIKTLRTDQSGDIGMLSDGNSIKLLNN